MSYALLWIEMLAIALLWTAAAAALSAHVKWKGDRILLVLGLVLLPWLVMSNWLKVRSWLPAWAVPEYVLQRHWYRWYPASWIVALILVAAYCSITGVALLRAMRRPQRGLARGVLVVLAALLPLIALGAILNDVGWIKYVVEVPTPWFGYFLLLLILAIVGEAVIVFLAMHRSAAGMNWSALSWPRARLAAATITAVAIGFMTLWNMNLEMRSRAAMLRLEAGNLMLSASPPVVAGANDAGSLYSAAFARLEREHWEILEPLRDTRTSIEVNAGKPPTDPRPQELVGAFQYVKVDPADPQVQAFLAGNERTIALLRQAASRPPGGDTTDQTHSLYDNARHIIGLLHLHARAEIMKGRIDSALADANILFHLRDYIAQVMIRWPGLAYLNDLAAIDVLQEVLPHVSRADQLTSLNMGDASVIRDILRRSFEGDEAWGLGLFSNLAAGQPIASSEEAYLNDYLYLKSEPHATFVRLFVLPGDLELYRRFMENCRQQATKPYFQTRGQVGEVTTWGSLEKRQTLLTSAIAHHVSNYFDLAARTEAAHATAVVGVAAMRYKLEHGQFAQKLDDLLAKDLDQIPIDPYDGHALRISTTDGQWKVYSIGPDGIDDGGKTRAGWATYVNKKGDRGDILFELNTR
jgi:hypothetical protein